MQIFHILHMESVITKQTFDDANRSGDVPVEESFCALCDIISDDHSKIKVFGSILLKFEQTVLIGKDILKEYGKHKINLESHTYRFTLNFIILIIFCFTEQTFPIEVSEPTCHQQFVEMRQTYSSFLDNVKPYISAGISSLEELKLYLQRHFQELQPQLFIAESFDDVMYLIEDKCTIINVHCVESIVNQYNITDAKPEVKKFKTEVDTFCDVVKLSACFQESFKRVSSSHHLICETIEFVFGLEADNYTLTDIKKLLSTSFKSEVNYVQIRGIINNDNCINLTCYAPQNLLDILQRTAEEELDLIKEMGVIRLKIGYRTIFDKQKIEEVHDDCVVC